MPDKKQQKEREPKVRRIRLTVRVTLAAYDAITEMQHRYRRKTGRALRLWEVLNAAVIAYAQKQGIKVRE